MEFFHQLYEVTALDLEYLVAGASNWWLHTGFHFQADYANDQMKQKTVQLEIG